MIELIEGFWINPDYVMAVKAADKGKCYLWLQGQSDRDGFLVDYPAEDVVEVLNDYFNEDEEEDAE